MGELRSTYTYETDENDVVVSDKITAGESIVLPAAYSYDEDGRNIKKSVTTGENSILDLMMEYDESGRITGSGKGSITSRYVYDGNEQLVRTNNSDSGSTSAYEYDSRGNMLTKKQYDYTTGDLNGLTPSETTTFTYANSGWKDQLVAVNGVELTYDANGNVITYGDTTYSWSHGTRLESITDGSNEYGYVYDESGIRFSKTVNGETTQFYYAGGLLLAQKTGEDVIFFQYGAGGVPLGFVLNGVQYFYITNQLGDVVGIADSQGEMFVYYTYDEWGNPLETLTRYGTEEEQNIAEINPLRYRGYYYDSETGYYYLQSRYYNPEWGRFISPDSFSYIDNSTRIGFNAYVYCINSPLMYSDPLGYKEDFNPNITEQGKAVVQIVFSFIFIDGITDLIEDTSKILYNGLQKMVKLNAELVGKMFIIAEAMMSTLWDEFKDWIENLFSAIFEKTLDGMTKAFDFLAESTKKLGEKVVKINPFAKIGTFIIGAISTMNNKIYTEMQKISLILVDALSLLIQTANPDFGTGTGLLIDLFAEAIKTIMKTGFLISNGNIFH